MGGGIDRREIEAISRHYTTIKQPRRWTILIKALITRTSYFNDIYGPKTQKPDYLEQSAMMFKCNSSPPSKSVMVLPSSGESERASTHIASIWCDAATDAGGSASDVGEGSNGGPPRWGSPYLKN